MAAVDIVRFRVASALEKLNPILGPNYKLTFVARCVNDELDADIIVTEDDLRKVSAAVDHLADTQERKG